MATSPIYGWLEPDNTDLVKNGALAIRTLGNAIDTTMGTMTPKSIVDAKGDLIAASANDTPARLAVGANGETLVADSSTSTGLRYQGSMAAGKNAIINGGFDIWQRGTSIGLNNNVGYGADRWYIFSNPTSTTARQTTNDTTNLPNIQYCARVQRNSGSTQLGVLQISNSLETVNSIPYSGRTVVFSFWARAGANYSSASNALLVLVGSGTGTDQRYANDATYTGANNFINQNATLTTTWQRFTYTGTVPSNGNELGVLFGYSPVGTAGANDYFEVTGVQLEIGSVATAFSRAGGSIQGELAACQRYYVRFTGTQPNALYASSLAFSTTGSVVNCQIPVSTRVYPTAIEYSALRLTDNVGAYNVTNLTLNSDGGTSNTITLTATVASGLTQFRGFFLTGSNTNNYIGLSAEL